MSLSALLSLACDACGNPIANGEQSLCAACRKPRAKALPNEGLHPRARAALGVLLETELPLQVQHLAKRNRLEGACGKSGQLVESAYSVTCPACRKIVDARALRRGAR